MQDLVAMATHLGWQNTKTYIQSGNLVFQANDPNADKLANLIEAENGFSPEILILNA